MQRFVLQVSLAMALVFSGVFLASPALAEKPSWAGDKGDEKHSEKDKHGKHKEGKGRDRGESGEKSGPGAKASHHFSEENRISVHQYYGDQFRNGRCPPGLAKKGNGCMPPGQAKKWKTGRPLPREAVFYDLPPEVLVQLGPAPSGHRFVRVASDILMIAAGTGMVVDAIEDIGRQVGR
jgi:hypothetical protein